MLGALYLSLRRLGVGYRRRRAEAFVGLLSGDEHPSGISHPSLTFPPCETEHPNPKLFGMPTNFSPMSLYWVRPATVDRMQELSGLRSLAGSTSTAMEAANPRPSPDTGGYLVFA